MKFDVYITLKKSVSDPQGDAILNALTHNGFTEVENVRLGKFLEVEVAGQNRKEAEAQLDKMCEKLLSNPVIEDYRFELHE